MPTSESAFSVSICVVGRLLFVFGAKSGGVMHPVL
jgi:hypothetical protein